MNISKDINNFLDLVCNSIKYSPIRESVRSELYEHIIEEKENYIKEGLSTELAEKRAITNMGTPKQISKNFNKIYRKKIDWKLLIIFILLIGINLLLTITIMIDSNNTNYIYKNVAYIFIGVIGTIILFFLDYKKIQKFKVRTRSFWINSWFY